MDVLLRIHDEIVQEVSKHSNSDLSLADAHNLCSQLKRFGTRIASSTDDGQSDIEQRDVIIPQIHVQPTTKKKDSFDLKLHKNIVSKMSQNFPESSGRNSQFVDSVTAKGDFYYANLSRCLLIHNVLESLLDRKISFGFDSCQGLGSRSFIISLQHFKCDQTEVEMKSSLFRKRTMLYAECLERILIQYCVGKIHVGKKELNKQHSCETLQRFLDLCLASNYIEFDGQHTNLDTTDKEEKYRLHHDLCSCGYFDQEVGHQTKTMQCCTGKKSDVGRDVGVLAKMNLSLYFQNHNIVLEKDGYDKNIKYVPVLNASGNPSFQVIVAESIEQMVSSAQNNMQSFVTIARNQRGDGRSQTFDECLSSRIKGVLDSYKEKYGSSSEGSNWDISARGVAESSLIFDLLAYPNHKQINATKLLHCVSDDEKNTSRDSIFVLYNYARLAMLLQQFEENVDKGLYPPLPCIDSVNFGLLREEMEWTLFLQYITFYPLVLQNILSALVSSAGIHIDPPVNKICMFLLSLSHHLSTYYHHIKVLLEPRPHLHPLMFARLYLIIGIKQIMENAFYLLGITPPAQM